jgi:dihydroflavonol-4-reductase
VKGRALITGGTGFVGSHTVEEYLRQGWRVRALVRNPARLGWLSGLDIEIAPGTLLDPGSLARAMEGCDLVVHCAGLTKAIHSQEYFRVNEEAVRDLTHIASERKVRRLVLCSSQAAAGPSSPGKPITEDDAPHPVSAYGRSKLAGERVLAEGANGLEWIILRPPAIIGPRDEQFLPLFRAVSRYGIYPRFGQAARRYSFASVHDIARALLVAGEVETGLNSVYFVAAPESLDWSDAAAAIAKFAGKKAHALPLGNGMLKLLGALTEAYAAMSSKPALLSADKLREILAPDWVCSTEKIRRTWGFECAWTKEATLRDTYEAYLKSGLL